MRTPICDFVRRYAADEMLRLHMPGHKGVGPLGIETLDLTEIAGADSLYEAEGVIRESEDNASRLFGCATFYSTEGSSQCIRAMLRLVLQRGRRVVAARNAHKTFLSAAALLDLDVTWLPATGENYLSCAVDLQTLERVLNETCPAAVYLTSPDYLGNMADIEAISAVCHRHGALLVVDNAHGAYLRFLHPSRHPIDLGADLCCDSAHKTLPVLTGGAYLHIADRVAELIPQAKNALALFGSTSPSYLILQSLDAANPYLERYPEQISNFLAEVEACRAALRKQGYTLCGDEPMKLTIRPKTYGYTGVELAEQLRRAHIECEFADPDYLVLMPTPETGAEGLCRLKSALCAIPRRERIETGAPLLPQCERILSIREAMLAPCETVPVQESLGRILAAATVGCPPAVPIVITGERINAQARSCFAYYGIETVCVVV